MKKFFKLDFSNKHKLSQKFVISYVLSSLIPILLMLYMIYVLIWPESEDILKEIRLLIFLIVCISVAGYLFSKRISRSILKMVENSKAIADGEFSRELKASEDDEIGELGESFNRVTRRLRQNIEELKESKNRIQDILSRVGSAVTSMHDIDGLLELIIQVVTDALNGTSGCIMLINKKTQKLFIKVAHGLSESTAKKTRIKIGDGPIGWVVRENKPLILPSNDTSRFNLESIPGYSDHSFLCVPLVHSEKVIGVIAINDKDKNGGRFNQDDVILLSNLSAQTATAIENARLSEDIERTYFETITALAMAVEAKDPYTRGHSNRVVGYCMMLAENFGLSDEEKEVLKEAALLHDIGKIGISDAILRKPGPLTKDEYELVKKHTIIGENIMKPIKRLSNLCDLVRHHQEWVNGEGYPDGLTGKELSVSVKILMVADSYDAMISDRPYRKALSVEQAKEELIKYSGTHFGKDIVDRFLKLI
ncbi:MAG: HD domain-containing protein [Candidatus Omnitrophota bacterium]|nr:HD domain-containing protein [Candidatus Omnitrophota bacterium]